MVGRGESEKEMNEWKEILDSKKEEQKEAAGEKTMGTGVKELTKGGKKVATLKKNLESWLKMLSPTGN